MHTLLTTKVTDIGLFELSKSKAEKHNKAAASGHRKRLDTSLKHRVALVHHTPPSFSVADSK